MRALVPRQASILPRKLFFSSSEQADPAARKYRGSGGVLHSANVSSQTAFRLPQKINIVFFGVNREVLGSTTLYAWFHTKQANPFCSSEATRCRTRLLSTLRNTVKPKLSALLGATTAAQAFIIRSTNFRGIRQAKQSCKRFPRETVQH